MDDDTARHGATHHLSSTVKRQKQIHQFAHVSEKGGKQRDKEEKNERTKGSSTHRNERRKEK